MKYYKQVIVAACVVCFLFISCGGKKGQSQLKTSLTGHTYQVVGMDSAVNQTCPAQEPATNLEELSISFGEKTCRVISPFTTVSTCLWEIVDTDTIRISLDQQIIELNIEVIQDDLLTNILFVSLAEGGATNFDCNDIGDIVSPAEEVPEEPVDRSAIYQNSVTALMDSLKGTWCYKSGYPYYLGLVFYNQGYDQSAYAAPFYKNADVFNGGNPNGELNYSSLMDLRSRTRDDKVIYRISILDIPRNYDDSNLSLERLSKVLFINEEKTEISINYGAGHGAPALGVFSKLDGDPTNGHCPELEVAQADSRHLPEMIEEDPIGPSDELERLREQYDEENARAEEERQRRAQEEWDEMERRQQEEREQAENENPDYTEAVDRAYNQGLAAYKSFCRYSPQACDCTNFPQVCEDLCQESAELCR